MKKDNTDIRNFDISEHLIDDEETLMEYALAGCIEEWQKSNKDPHKHINELREDAMELLAVAQDPIPAWNKVKLGPYAFENGLLKTPTGTALIHNGYFVMLEDLVERLPRIE